jgi:hypothetical protein
MVRPLKVGMPLYRETEARVMACVCEAFELTLVEPSIVKVADRILLATERRDLMPPSSLAWRDEEQVEPCPARIVPMSPRLAEYAFLDRFTDLWGQR